MTNTILLQKEKGVVSDSLKILQWNVCDKTCPKVALQSAINSEPDIICVQELAMHDVITIPGYQLFVAIDFININGPVYLAILVKENIKVVTNSHTVLDHNTKLSNHWFDQRYGYKTTFKQSHSILINHKNRVIQVVNFHLSNNCSIRRRHADLLRVKRGHYDKKRYKHPIIMCFDGNTFGHPLSNAFVGIPFFGVKFSELPLNEITLLKQFAKKTGLRLLFEKITTYRNSFAHYFFGLHLWGHLDHIMVTHSAFELVSKMVVQDEDSDHDKLLVHIKLREPTQ